MEKRLDGRAVAAIVLGTILVIIVNRYMYVNLSVPREWAIQVCIVIVVIISAVFGILAGAIIPFVSSVIIGASFLGFNAVDELFLLLLFGVTTGHYADRLMVRKGQFVQIRLIDFFMIETALSVLAWICIHPLGRFYMYGTDLRISLNEGVKYCAVSIAANLCICLPVLIVCNRLFRKRRIVEDAEREYLYRS